MVTSKKVDSDERLPVARFCRDDTLIKLHVSAGPPFVFAVRIARDSTKEYYQPETVRDERLPSEKEQMMNTSRNYKFYFRKKTDFLFAKKVGREPQEKSVAGAVRRTERSRKLL